MGSSPAGDVSTKILGYTPRLEIEIISGIQTRRDKIYLTSSVLVINRIKKERVLATRGSKSKRQARWYPVYKLRLLSHGLP